MEEKSYNKISGVSEGCKSNGIAVPEGVKNIYKEITGEEWVKKEIYQFATIYCMPKTQNKETLAKIYSAADYFVNPTHEDNFPTTNLEAAACGTRVITYDVGCCKETIQC